jgi:hypothetical protein
MWGWLMTAWRWLVAQLAPSDPELPPALAAFLAGQSVRQATYLNQGTDPALMSAPDWPTAIKATEQLIRAHIAQLEAAYDDLEADYDALEAKYLDLEADHARLTDALITQGAEQ